MIPFYADSDYLARMLASVQAQTDPDWRCVVIDDSAGRNGAEELVEFVGDPRIEYRRNVSNLGIAGNFEQCFSVAREWGVSLAAVVHADDELEPHYLAVVKAAHLRHPDAVAVAPRASIIGADGAPRRTLADSVKQAMWPRHADVLVGDDGLRRLLNGMFFYCPAVSYRMALVPVPAWDTTWKQVMDLDLYGRLLLDGASIVLEPTAVYRYRRHAATMTEQNSTSLVRSHEEMVVCRALAHGAAAQGWRRSRRAGTWRWSVRAQALVQAVRHVAVLRFGGAMRAALYAVRP